MTKDVVSDKSKRWSDVIGSDNNDKITTAKKKASADLLTGLQARSTGRGRGGDGGREPGTPEFFPRMVFSNALNSAKARHLAEDPVHAIEVSAR